MKKQRMYDRVLKKLKKHDQDKPVYSSELERRFKIDGAVVRDLIRRMRRNYEPIANTLPTTRKHRYVKRYFYAGNRTELKATIGDMRGREKSIGRTTNCLINAKFGKRKRGNNGKL